MQETQAISLTSMTQLKKQRLVTRIERLTTKITWFTYKMKAAASVATKNQLNFETDDVMLLLDAKRLHDQHQFTEKQINSAETKEKMIAESFNQGFTALPKGGYGVALDFSRSCIWTPGPVRNRNGLLRNGRIHNIDNIYQ